ncbi:hypothetical protein INR49_017712 [Caranx melampygus]|nr:hypothetical protein INR49_017712 [Caranx melampygus]
MEMGGARDGIRYSAAGHAGGFTHCARAYSNSLCQYLSVTLLLLRRIEVTVGEQKVLLVHTHGQYSAIGSQCSHYNAPLVKGSLVGDRVRCPFHGACFNVKTGNIEYPGLDCLPSYKQVRVEDGKVYVSVKTKLTKQVKMCGLEPDIKHTILLVGGGPASLAMNLDSSSILLHSSDFYQQYGIEVWTQREMLEEQTVKFYMNDRIIEIKGKNGKVEEVVLDSGTVLEADVVIVGIGVIPNSDLLSGSQVGMDSGKAVIVDKFMRTNVTDIFSAGDVTSFPLAIHGDERVNIGHWQMSQAQGRVAALNMLNKPTKLESVPFFWTMLLGKSIRYTGYGEGYTEIIFKGKVEERKFLTFYIKDEVVVAAASLMFDPAVARLAELMATGQILKKAQAQADDLSWLQM